MLHNDLISQIKKMGNMKKRLMGMTYGVGKAMAK